MSGQRQEIDAGAAAAAAWIDAIEARSNLTRSQFLIWMGQTVEPATPLYNMIFAWRLRGPLDRARFETAFALLLADCDALRTVVREDEGVPQQQVLPDVGTALEFLDLSVEPHADAAYAAWEETRVRRRLPLAERLFDSVLVRLGPEDHIWYLNQHHIITDAWSTTLLFGALAQRYAAPAEAAPLPGFAEYVARERAGRESARHAGAREYWANVLARPAQPVDFYAGAKGALSSRTRRVRCRLGADRSAAVRRLAHEPGVRLLNEDLSLFRVFATLILGYLQRISAAGRLALGAPLHNRPTATDKATPGLFIEVFPLLVDIAADATFASLLDTVGSQTMPLLANAVTGVSTAASNGAYDVLLNFVPARMPALAGVDVATDWVHSGAGDRAHKLRIQVHDFDSSGDIVLDFDFNCSVFDAPAERLAIDHFLALLDAVLADRDVPLAQVDLHDSESRARQLVAFNQTAAPLPDAVTVFDLFAEQAMARPGAAAVRSGTTTLSYADLMAQVNDLAARLAKAGAVAGSVVAILMERSAEAVIAMLAALKTGAAYLPLDPRHPPARLAAILEDVRDSRLTLAAVLTDATNAGCVPIPVPELPVTLSAGPAAGDPTHAASPASGELAYLIYTSGSTGTPKGVEVGQRALVNYLCWARGEYCGGQHPAFALHSSLAVDLTVTSVFVPLIAGGTVVVYADSGANDLPILRVFEEDAVDVVKLTPAHLALVRELGVEAQRIRTLILGGEDLKADLVRALLPQLPRDVAIYNEYGPTEGTVGCMHHRFDPASDTAVSVPIGTPIANARIYLLDDDLQPAPTGLTGEICIGGAGVASGYLNQPELTGEKFVAWGDERLYRTGDVGRWGTDGRLAYLGRGDHQIKIRGTRIEPGDVEAALQSHPAVRQCVTTVLNPVATQAVHYCSRCGLPSNYPGAQFDAAAVCNLCLAFDQFAAQAQRYFATPDELREEAARIQSRRRGAHDCIVLLSGGKDSTYMLYQVVALGLKVLALTLDNGFVAEGAKDNVRRTVADLGIDHRFVSTPHMDAIFADSLARHSNVCHGCFKTIYTLAMQEARERDIGYIFTGLSRGQIFETRLHDLFRHRIFDVAQIEAAILEARKVYHRIDDAVAAALGVELFADDAIFREVQFVDFYRYWDVPLDDVYRFLATKAPWVRPADTGRSTNCLINDAGIYVHKKERGFHNYALPYSWDVRLGHKTRAAALHELNDEIDTRRVRGILDQVGYTEKPARDEARLVAYYAAAAALPAVELRDHLAARLPEEMLPAHFVHLDALPLTSTGKIDRRALPPPGELHAGADADYVAPATEIERRVAAIWSELLDVARIGAHDNFFDLGGMSLTAIQTLSRLREAFQVELPVQSFFRAPNVAAVAQGVEELLIAQIDALSDEEVERMLGAEGQ